MPFLETGDVESWLVAQFQPNGALDSQLQTLGAKGVYGYRMPQGKPRCGLVFSLVTAEDDNNVRGGRAASRMIYLVKAIAEGVDSTPADTLMQRADILLQQRAGSVPGLKILSCVRQSAVKYPETYEGKCYWHVGGQYRIWAEQS